MKINCVVQIGIIVTDIRTAAKKWAEVLGVPVPEASQTFDYDVTGARYKGEPCHGGNYQVAFEFDNIQVELIQPDGKEPSVWRDCLEKYGNHIHHFAFKTENMQKSIDHFNDLGLELLQGGDFPPDGKYAYIDSQQELGAIVELLQADWDDMKKYPVKKVALDIIERDNGNAV